MPGTAVVSAPAVRGVDTFEAMGTVVSLRHSGAAPVSTIGDVFEGWEARFSLYSADSEASRIARGELPLTAASATYREVYAESLDWRTATSGSFTPHRPDGVIDLSGTVKARAMADAQALLEAAGGSWLLAVGGDVCGSGDEAESPWRIGIVDPDDRTRLVGAVALDTPRGAVATSGTAERGEHVWRTPRAGGPGFAQVSVVSRDIVQADVLATAILAGGRDSLDDLTDRYDIDVLAFEAAGGMLATPGMRFRMGASAHRA